MASLANLFSHPEDPAAAEAPLLSASSASHTGGEAMAASDSTREDAGSSRVEPWGGMTSEDGMGEDLPVPDSRAAYEDYSIELNDVPRTKPGRGRVAALRADADPEERLFKKRKASIADMVRPRFSSFAGLSSSSAVGPGESI